MKNLIITLIILLVCLSIAETSFAGEAPGTVATYGYTNYYPDGSTTSAYSNPVRFSNNATTFTYGNTAFTHSNTIYGANGTISSTYDNTTYFGGNASRPAPVYKNPLHK